MIKTLRITTRVPSALCREWGPAVLVVIVAGILFASLVLFGTRTDAKFEQFMHSPGVVEKFNSAATITSQADRTQVSPLVQQAEAFGLYLDPPPAPAAKATGQRLPTQSPSGPARASFSPKFRLIGTCFYAARPEQSLAFVDEPGKGLRWVRQGAQIGHLVIEQIKDGLIVYKNDQNSVELAVEARQPQTSLLEGAATARAPTPTNAGPRPVSTPPVGAGTALARTVDSAGRANTTRPHVTRQPSRPLAEEIGPAESAALMDLVEKLKSLQRSAGSEKTDSATDPREQAAMMQKLVADFKAQRNGAEAARKPGQLRELLPAARPDPNRNRYPKIARPATPPGPNPAPKN